MAKPRLFSARACPYARIAIDYANAKFSPAYHAFLRTPSPESQRELEGVLAFLEHELLGALAERPAVNEHRSPSEFYIQRYSRFVSRS